MRDSKIRKADGIFSAWACACVAILAATMLLSGMSSASAADADAVCAQRPVVDKGAIQNLGQWKTRLIYYKKCGEYDRAAAAVFARAQRYILTMAPRVKNPAIVFDIDETTLDNWQEIKQNDFGYIPAGECTFDPGKACGNAAWDASEGATAIAPALALFGAVKGRVAVFFVTGRFDLPNGQQERQHTESNLKKAGYDAWKELFMRTDKNDSVAIYKSKMRARIEAEGYTIVANIGDQKSDLANGHQKKTFKVPNPFYFIQ